MNLIQMFFGRRFSMKSPYSPAGCARRLKPEVDSFWRFLSKKPLNENAPWIGKIDEKSIYLRPRTIGPLIYRTVCHASLSGDGEGTILICRTSMGLGFKIILTFAIAGLIVRIFAFPFGHTAPISLSENYRLIGGLCLLLGYVGFSRFAFARHDEELLVEFLETTIGAKRV